MTRLIVFSVVAGIVLGYGTRDALNPEVLESLVVIALAVLCFGIGLDLGQSGNLLGQLKEAGSLSLLLPLVTAVSSIVATGIAGSLVGLTAGSGAAVGAGFGWYSLSAVLLTQLQGPELGTIAFITNVTRELLAVVLAPFIARWSGGPAVIAAAGATSMDVALPVIIRVAGNQAALLAFLHGVILSLLVPLLVPLLAGL